MVECPLTNRQKAQQSTKHKFWCYKCDGALVGEIGRCPNCRSIQNRKKKKG